jgi:hypothetical protein
MIHEYRCYRLFPELFLRYCSLAEDLVPRLRGDKYGKLVGFWSSIGIGNCTVHHIWQYESLDERMVARQLLSQDSEWIDQFIKNAWPTMAEQTVRFLNPLIFNSPPSGDHRYQIRVYKGASGAFTNLSSAIASRPRSSDEHLVALYTAESPDPNEIIEVVCMSENIPTDLTRTFDNFEWLESVGGLLKSIEVNEVQPLGLSPLV